MDNVFFTFIKPYLNFIDHGHLFRKPFSWLYIIIACLNLFFPFYVFYSAVDNDLFDMPFKFVFAFFLIWLIIAFVSWISFQIWWDRKGKILNTSQAGDDFIATPVFAHFIQTFGEWMGTYIAIVGFFLSLLATLFLGAEGRMLAREIGLGFINPGLITMILFPVYGFLWIVVARFFAEQFRALSAIANSVSKGSTFTVNNPSS